MADRHNVHLNVLEEVFTKTPLCNGVQYSIVDEARDYQTRLSEHVFQLDAATAKLTINSVEFTEERAQLQSRYTETRGACKNSGTQVLDESAILTPEYEVSNVD